MKKGTRGTNVGGDMPGGQKQNPSQWEPRATFKQRKKAGRTIFLVEPSRRSKIF